MSMHTKWHSTYRWQQHRLRQLQQQPLCAMCLTQCKVTAATVADHITPHKGDYELFWHGRSVPMRIPSQQDQATHRAQRQQGN